MKKQFSLEPLTIISCPPPEMVRIAARSGYDFISFRNIPMGVAGECSFYPDDKAMVQETKAALKETGIGVHDIELARIMRDVDFKSYLPAMEMGAELGAKHLISSAWTDVRIDRNFIIDSYAEICDLAKPFGLTVSLEFPSFSRLTNLQEAADIVKGAGRSNCGILLDTLYIHFSQIGLDEIAALPKEWFQFVHLCDAPAGIPGTRDGLIQIARDARLYPGEGCIDFAAIDNVLSDDVIYSIELPNTKRIEELGFEGHARRCIEAAKNYFAEHGKEVAAVQS